MRADGQHAGRERGGGGEGARRPAQADSGPEARVGGCRETEEHHRAEERPGSPRALRTFGGYGGYGGPFEAPHVTRQRGDASPAGAAAPRGALLATDPRTPPRSPARGRRRTLRTRTRGSYLASRHLSCQQPMSLRTV